MTQAPNIMGIINLLLVIAVSPNAIPTSTVKATGKNELKCSDSTFLISLLTKL